MIYLRKNPQLIRRLRMIFCFWSFRESMVFFVANIFTIFMRSLFFILFYLSIRTIFHDCARKHISSLANANCHCARVRIFLCFCLLWLESTRCTAMCAKKNVQCNQFTAWLMHYHETETIFNANTRKNPYNIFNDAIDPFTCCIANAALETWTKMWIKTICCGWKQKAFESSELANNNSDSLETFKSIPSNWERLDLNGIFCYIK